MFTMTEMRQLYAEHGERLAMLDEYDDGPFSANPGDYFMASEDHVFPGTLVVIEPASMMAVTE